MSRPSETLAAVTVDDPGRLGSSAVGRVVDTFREHVEDAEGGMAFVLHQGGAPVLRLAGGTTHRGTGRPWAPSTPAVLFSGTKGVVATLVAMLVDRVQIDPEELIADRWPEFAAAGKGEARLHHVLAHTLGLLYVDPPPEGDEALDNALMAQRLADQEPLWEPGSRVAYHAMTYGYLLTEVLRRATGRSVGELVRTMLAEPHGLDLHLGLPEPEEPRLAPVFRSDGYRVSTFLEDDPQRRAVVDRMYAGTLLGDDEPFGTRASRAAELAAGGAVGSADAMASLYSLLVREDPVVSRETLATFTRTWSEGTDAVNDRPVRFGLGFELDDPIGTYGPVRPAFGHSGAGGGLHGAWPSLGASFSFLTDEMRSEDVDRRAKDLLAASARALDGG